METIASIEAKHPSWMVVKRAIDDVKADLPIADAVIGLYETDDPLADHVAPVLVGVHSDPDTERNVTVFQRTNGSGSQLWRRVAAEDTWSEALREAQSALDAQVRAQKRLLERSES